MTRKRYSSEDKVGILREHLETNAAVPDVLIAQQIPAGRRLERDIHPAICVSEQNQVATAGSVRMNVPIQMPHRRNFRCDQELK